MPSHSVPGVTNIDDFHTFRGSTRPKPASNAPISLRQPRTPNLTLEHPQLVAEEENLDLLLPLRAMTEYAQLEESPQRPVQERDRDALRPTRHDH